MDGAAVQAFESWNSTLFRLSADNVPQKDIFPLDKMFELHNNYF
jgi:hypothetical protein